jgi:hypothetical protein
VIPVHSLVPDLLADVLRRQPLSPAKVTFAWRTAVGPAVDRATRVSLGEHGVLEVVASDGHWKREVQRSTGLVLARLVRLLGEGVVRRIVVKTAGRARGA